MFFEDDATGEYGLTHKQTYNHNISFNAFWSGIGIFHDIFEHYHEYSKYFLGQYAMNIGGEMAAMGHMTYYVEKLGVYNRLKQGYNFRGTEHAAIETTSSMVEEAIQEGYSNYGYTLESNVPKQAPINETDLEYELKDFYKYLFYQF